MSLCVVISYSNRVAIIEPLVGVEEHQDHLDVLLISYSKRVAIIEPLVGVDLDVLLLTTSTACP